MNQLNILNWVIQNNPIFKLFKLDSASLLFPFILFKTIKFNYKNENYFNSSFCKKKTVSLKHFNVCTILLKQYSFLFILKEAKYLTIRLTITNYSFIITDEIGLINTYLE